jgi:hypothetical protein
MIYIFGMKSGVTRDGDVDFLSYCEAREDFVLRSERVALAESSENDITKGVYYMYYLYTKIFQTIWNEKRSHKGR